MLEVDDASLAKENKGRKDQIDSMVEESKREEDVSIKNKTEHCQCMRSRRE